MCCPTVTNVLTHGRLKRHHDAARTFLLLVTPRYTSPPGRPPWRSRGGAEEGRAAPPSKGPPSTRSEQHQPPRATITDDGRLGLGGTWGWLALPAARGQPGLYLLITRHVTTAREARPPDHAPNNTITDPVPDNGSLRYTFNYTDHFVKLLLFAITRALITYSRPE